jgi:hypothetical protein
MPSPGRSETPPRFMMKSGSVCWVSTSTGLGYLFETEWSGHECTAWEVHGDRQDHTTNEDQKYRRWHILLEAQKA